MYSILLFHYVLHSKTGGLHFGTATCKNLKNVIAGFQHVGIKYEELSAIEANEQFTFFKLPSDYKCVIEEDAGILAAGKAVDVLQVLNLMYVRMCMFVVYVCILCACGCVPVCMRVWYAITKESDLIIYVPYSIFFVSLSCYSIIFESIYNNLETCLL